MTENELNNWLQQQASTLDTIIANASRRFHLNARRYRSSEQFGFDLGECQAESWKLGGGEDLCYDRLNTPFVYSLWYHARRVNTFLSHFSKIIFEARNQSTIEIFDLGAGTGAVQWGIGLVYHKLKQEGIKSPVIKVFNIDTSPLMLDYNRYFLWEDFKTVYHHCNDFSAEISYNVNSWMNTQNISLLNPWITASYLFDVSDTTVNGEFRKATVDSFKQILSAYNPTKVLLLTSTAKEHLLDEVSKEFHVNQYSFQKYKNVNLIMKGNLERVNDFRLELFQTYKPFLTGWKESSIASPATWHDRSFVATVLSKVTVEMFSTNAVNDNIKLHSSAIQNRSEVHLNNEQLKAARNLNQPTVIIGPAGSGKSIVITERIKNIVEENNYNPEIRILLTTFNIELLHQLKNWTLAVLDTNKIKAITLDEGSKIYFQNNETLKANIHILHFDMLPKYLGNVPYWGLVDEHQHRLLLSEIVTEVKISRSLKDEYSDILNFDFLYEEYYRVIYGLQVGIQNARGRYMEVLRRGRGQKLSLNQREVVWDCLEQYARRLFSERIPSFVIRRQLLLNRLLENPDSAKFDYVIVDEFQDCTRADFEIFFTLLKDPNNIIVSGDLAQAVHLGRSANTEALREAIRSGRELRDISWNYLDGSYRLPFRICEAIKKISEHIHLSFKKNHAARVLSPYKGAPPGARPIVVWGNDEEDVAKKISSITFLYKPYGIEDKCILENDYDLGKKLRIKSDSVLRLKGIEKKCVIWSTRVGIEHQNEMFEYVYTILSRTSCLLIIVLFANHNTDGTKDYYKNAIGLFDQERLIYWDKETKDNFNYFRSTVPTVVTSEE